MAHNVTDMRTIHGNYTWGQSIASVRQSAAIASIAGHQSNPSIDMNSFRPDLRFYFELDTLLYYTCTARGICVC